MVAASAAPRRGARENLSIPRMLGTRVSLSPLIFCYAAILAFSGIATVTGYHRMIFAATELFGAPDLLEAALTGFLNAGWHDLAYVIARPLQRAEILSVLPLAATLLSLAASAGLFFRRLAGVYLARLCLLYGTAVALAATLQLLRRLDDEWRLVMTVSFLAWNIVWYLCFRKGVHVLPSDAQPPPVQSGQSGVA